MGKEMGKKYVLNNDLQEESVPNSVAICTKDAFIKSYTASSTSHREWTKTDALAYRQEMFDSLKTDFNVSL